MSRAIRHEIGEYGETLRDIPDDVLSELTEILGAFFYDLVGEQDRRGWGSERPAATVAREMKRLNACLEAHHESAVIRRAGGACIICEGVDATLDLDPGGAGSLVLGRDSLGDGDGESPP
jgi:hypothetical protein